MFTLGYDVGSSSIKCTLLDTSSGKHVSTASYPPDEMTILTPEPGWAEQDPETWWDNVKHVTRQVLASSSVQSTDIKAIGISYQMHGLVLVDRTQKPLRPSIIWCDSRAVTIGNDAFNALGGEYCLSRLGNSPGNFTASKLRWVQQNEPAIFRSIYKAMLPGDYIAMKLTGMIRTTISGLSEGIFWDFQDHALSERLLSHYAIDEELLPEVVPTFSRQGELTAGAAHELGLREGTVVSYRAGDQPNNAFSLNVINPGDVAATAGPSGVVYGVADHLLRDAQSRVNQFAHVNHSPDHQRLGILMCVNGTGILNSWLRRNFGCGESYEELNLLARKVPPGSNGLTFLPFGNGAERILENRTVGGGVYGLDLNRHAREHIFRAAQEGIAFALLYGMNLMKDMGMPIDIIRAGRTNMFLSPVFRQTLADAAKVTIELYETDGSQGAARGAAVGAGLFGDFDQAFRSLAKTDVIRPDEKSTPATQEAYEQWTQELNSAVSRAEILTRGR
jgi:xylulokinase